MSEASELEGLNANLAPLMRQFVAIEKKKNRFLLDENGQVIATRDNPQNPALNQNVIDIQCQVSQLYPELYEEKRVAFVLITPILLKLYQQPSTAH